MEKPESRILVADAHEILRKGVRAVVDAHPEWSICGEARNGLEAVKLSSELNPDIVILDLDIPELGGVEATRQIKQGLVGTEVLVFTYQDAEWVIADALKAGARGYVLKSDSEQTLVNAIDALLKHAPYFSAKPSEMLLRHLLGSDSESGDSTVLSPREIEVVRLLCEGKSNKEVASHLRISVKTVETHRATILRKLGLTSIVDLVRYAIRNNLIRP
jgi:DNA-binding NarL/FixJ family response regulator